jgi:hypothetical protein
MLVFLETGRSKATQRTGGYKAKMEAFALRQRRTTVGRGWESYLASTQTVARIRVRRKARAGPLPK